jgi:hypothetical protein
MSVNVPLDQVPPNWIRKPITLLLTPVVIILSIIFIICFSILESVKIILTILKEIKKEIKLIYYNFFLECWNGPNKKD